MATKTLARVQALTPAIGAVVEGTDLRDHLDPATVAAIRQALLDHGVIFFHDQPLSREQLRAFALNFGQIGTDSPAPPPDEVAEMVTTEPKGTTDIWHADATYMEAPNMGAVMRAVRLPPVGGDTCWASMYAAYDALSEPMQAMVDGLTALHSLFPVMERLRRLGDRFDGYLADAARGGYPEHIHPVVHVHPETGRKLLFVNSSWTTRIVELEPAESAKGARTAVRSHQGAGLQRPFQVVAGRHCILGQSRRSALRGSRLQRRKGHEPGGDRRRPAIWCQPR